MFGTILNHFTDSVLRGPTIGCMLMCLAAAIIGVIVVLRKESLIGESLSHATYPGVIIGVLVAGFLNLDDTHDIGLSTLIMTGAALSALAGMYVIQWLQRRAGVKSDAALCFVLSSFFGFGALLASQVQFTHTALYRQTVVYLFGQAATMTDVHIWIYGALAIAVILTVALLYKELQLTTFDREFSKCIGLKISALDSVVFILIVISIVIGIRSVGVVLISAMLIAPAVAARQYTKKMSMMFVLAAIIGVSSGFLGNFLSIELGEHFAQRYPDTKISFPTGPMIVIVAISICLLSLLLAPERGWLVRQYRIAKFRYTCVCESVLKTMWRKGQDASVSVDQISSLQNASKLYLRFVLNRLMHNGWVDRITSDTFSLSPDGKHWAGRIERLHRLWEVYLTEYIGVGAERVHCSAEEMQHIITPELEKELTLLLKGTSGGINGGL